MRKQHLVLYVTSIFLLVFTSCATRFYAFDSDYNGKKFDGEYTDTELDVKAAILDGSILVENFEDSKSFPGFEDFRAEDIKDGTIASISPGNKVGHTLRYNNSGGFSSVTVCWKRTSSEGHLILWGMIPGFGMPTLFNDAHGYGGHVHLDSLSGKTRSIGWNETASASYIIQELRVEGDEIVFLRNGSVFARYKMDKPRKFNGFAIGNNGGGKGLIDYIIIK